jgi:uncharacterized protein YndB with AHSA1/START domain
MTTSATNELRWPDRYLPAKSAVFVRNEIVIPATPAEVWPWLLRAEVWPEWYNNSGDIHFLSHAGPNLRNRSRFRWKTFGVRLTSKVLEFEPPVGDRPGRLAWDAHGIGVEAYHTWDLTPLPDGSTYVLTEETQNGWLARLGKALMPQRLGAKHQSWLEGLAAKAQSGPPA